MAWHAKEREQLINLKIGLKERCKYYSSLDLVAQYSIFVLLLLLCCI